ncbi:hypothetical protein FIBSPDRAFT_962673, partial [Athelia psychrophila]
MPTPSPCVACAGECAEFIAENSQQPIPQMGALCLCGHVLSDHQRRIRRLPPKGGCPDSGCIAFQPVQEPVTAQSLCTCGMGYLRHTSALAPSTGTVQSTAVPLLQPPPPPSSQPQNSPAFASIRPSTTVSGMVPAWSPPSVATGSANQQRRDSSFRNPTGIPSSSIPAYHTAFPSASSQPRGRSQNPFPGGTRRAGRSTQSNAGNFQVLIFPYTHSSSSHDDAGEDFPGPPLLAFQKIQAFIQRLQERQFCLDVSLSGAPGVSVFPQLISQLSAHNLRYNLQWVLGPGSTASSGTIVTDDYTTSPVMIYQVGKVSRDRMSHPLVPVTLPTHSLDIKSLSQTLSKKIHHPNDPNCQLLAIAPRWGKVRVLDVSTNLMHMCSGARLMNGFHTPDVQESISEVTCLSSCEIPPLLPASPLQNLFGPWSRDSAGDQFLPASRTPTPPPPSPSPSPAPSPTFPSLSLPDSIAASPSHSSPPPFPPSQYSHLRHRPDPVQPPASSVVFSPRNIREWKTLIKAYIAEQIPGYTEGAQSLNPVHIRATCISSGASMLWRKLRSLLGGMDNVDISDLPGDAWEKQIGEFELFALFREQASDTWIIGQGVGPGAKRAVIGALLQVCIQDVRLCKQVNAEGYYSLATYSASITPDHSLDIQTLALLCLLYIFTFELAPDPISPALFQFAIGGLPSIIDLNFVSSFAPETAQKLAAWPLDTATPLDLSSQDVRNIIFEHLDMQPIQLVNSTPAQREIYQGTIFASELLGCSITGIGAVASLDAFRRGLRTSIFPTHHQPLIETFGGG